MHAVTSEAGAKCNLCGILKSRSKKELLPFFFFFTVKSVTVTWKSKQAVDILGKGSLKMNTVTINQVLHKNSAVHRFAESS